MRGDRFLTQPLGKMMRYALCEPTRVDEDQRGAVLCGESGEPVVNFRPHFVGRNWSKLAAGNFDCQVQLAAMTDLDDRRIGAIAANQKTRHEFDRSLRCGKSDACEAPAGQMVEAFERKGQVGTTLVVGHGM